MNITTIIGLIIISAVAGVLLFVICGLAMGLFKQDKEWSKSISQDDGNKGVINLTYKIK